MGHSYIEYANKHYHARDYNIKWLCRFLREEFQNRIPDGDFTTNIKGLFEWWETNEAFPGPGCINVRLDEFITDRDTQKQFFSLLDGVKRTVESYGAAIPVDDMNRHYGGSGFDIFINSMPVPPMVEFIDTVRQLVEGGKFDRGTSAGE